MKTRMTDDLVRIASAGGGFRLEAGTRMTDDLVRIASAASQGGGTVYFSGIKTRMTADLVRIASAGNGHVVFED